MVHLPVWQQGRELLPDGLDEVRSDHGHGDTLLRREASDTPRMIEHPVPALQTDSRPLLPQALSAFSSDPEDQDRRTARGPRTLVGGGWRPGRASPRDERWYAGETA